MSYGKNVKVYCLNPKVGLALIEDSLAQLAIIYLRIKLYDSDWFRYKLKIHRVIAIILSRKN
jgi:hypothetical protein